MNLYYLPLPLAEFPSRWAHSIEHIKMCEAFSKLGIHVRFILHAPPASDHARRVKESLQTFYGVHAGFQVVTLPALKPRGPGVLRHLKVDTLSMSGTALAYLLWNHAHGRLGADDVVYCRNRAVAGVAAKSFGLVPVGRRPKVIYEIHEPEDDRFAFLATSVTGFVTISAALARHLTSAHRVPRNRIFVERCAADLTWFAQAAIPRKEARRRLGLPEDESPIVGYCGRIEASRGVDILLEAARRFGERGWRCLVIGGGPEEALRLPGVREIPPEVVFGGRVAPSRVPECLSACDVLVAPLPDRSQYDIGSSPLKLFEYMAVQRPIVATRVPAVQEILQDGQEAILVEPRSSEDLLRGISWILDHPAEAQQLATAAHALARTHTWERRARRILEFIGGLQHLDGRFPAAVGAGHDA